MTTSNYDKLDFYMHLEYLANTPNKQKTQTANLGHCGKYHTSGCILYHPTLHQNEQPSESGGTFTQQT